MSSGRLGRMSAADRGFHQHSCVFSTVFLPMTFVTSYFGMSFGVITKDLDTIWRLWLARSVSALPAEGYEPGVETVPSMAGRGSAVRKIWQATPPAEPRGHAPADSS